MTKARSNATAPNAKGTLVVGNGTDASTTLAVASTAGYVLTVDSAEATGLKWATPAAGGYTELASGTPSGATLNLTSISGSYRDLVLIWRNVRPDSNGEHLNMRFNADTNNRYNITENNADNGLACRKHNGRCQAFRWAGSTPRMQYKPTQCDQHSESRRSIDMHFPDRKAFAHEFNRSHGKRTLQVFSDE